jgi:hypothetical protein
MDILSMFLLLLATGLGLSGVAGYLIFGPLAYRHLQDRSQTVGANAFAPSYLAYLLKGEFRRHRDRNLNGLATPAQVLLLSAIIGGLGSLTVLWLV